MRKKLALLLFALAAIAPAGAISPVAAAKATLPPLALAASCPKGSHLFICPTYSFCCPNNAFCACLQH